MLTELFRGRVRWDLLTSFPEQDPADRAAGDAVIARLGALLTEWVDADDVEISGRLPDELMPVLQDAGMLRLTIDPSLGGRGLSTMNALRVVERAARYCTPVAFALAINNGFGSGSYLSALPAGPLRDMITERVAAGIVSAGADAERIGTANQRRATTATLTEDGSAYLINGEKVYIGNGVVADLMDVSATIVEADGTEEVGLFFVDTRTPGFSVILQHEFMGLRGAAIGNLQFDDVRVPVEHRFVEETDGWRMRPDGEASVVPDATDLRWLATIGRTMVVGPAALGIARLCLAWSQDFVARRKIDGHDLGEYEEIQRLVSETAADVFLIDSVLTWGVLGSDRADTVLDLTAAKNAMSLACWRTVDRTLSLFGAEGYETARSKARRGAPPVPVERAFRDARSLRVAGGVDFMLDLWTARSVLAELGTAAPVDRVEMPRRSDLSLPAGVGGWMGRDRPGLTDHARFVESHAGQLAADAGAVAGPAPADPTGEAQRVKITLGAIGRELSTMVIMLGRAAGMAGAGNVVALELADVACRAARHRISALRSQLADEPGRAVLPARRPPADLAFLLADLGPATLHPSSAPASDRPGNSSKGLPSHV